MRINYFNDYNLPNNSTFLARVESGVCARCMFGRTGAIAAKPKSFISEDFLVSFPITNFLKWKLQRGLIAFIINVGDSPQEIEGSRDRADWANRKLRLVKVE